MLRLLLIDDNPDDRALILRTLKREFDNLNVEEILEAEGLNQALDVGNFDLVITDYQLRWNDGLTVLREIKSRYPDCPVIMFTDSGSQEVAVEAMKAGLDDYLIKSTKHFVRLPIAILQALQRTESQRRVERLEVRLQTLLNRLNVGVFRSTLDGNLLEGNAAFLRLLGVSSLEEAQTLNLQEPFLKSDAEFQALNQEREVQLRRADGSSIWILVNQTLNTTETEPIIEGLIEDITDRKLAQEALQRANDELEIRVAQRTQELQQTEAELREALKKAQELSELKSRIITTISHEYRTPLTTIFSSAQLLEFYSHKFSQEKKLAHLRRIQISSQHLTNLVNDVLFIGQAEADKLTCNPVSIDLKQFCRDVIEEISSVIYNKKHVSETIPKELIAFSTHGNCTNTYLDEQLLRQILANLLSNAIKYSPDGGTVQFNVECIDGVVRFTIQDHGIGIPQNELPQLFESFHRATNVGTIPGTGLGLAIVKKCVDLHGGQITVDSIVNKGTTFTVTLPIH